MKTNFYHQVMFDYDVALIREYIIGNWGSLWKDLPERKTWYAQEETDVTLLYNLPDSFVDVFNRFHIKQEIIEETRLADLFRKITKITNRRLGRAMLIKLPAKKRIATHIDRGHHLENCYRIHLPIITDDNVSFVINKVVYPMPAGVVANINNNVEHSVENNSENDRVHLVMDYIRKDDKHYQVNETELNRFC